MRAFHEWTAGEVAIDEMLPLARDGEFVDRKAPVEHACMVAEPSAQSHQFQPEEAR